MFIYSESSSWVTMQLRIQTRGAASLQAIDSVLSVIQKWNLFHIDPQTRRDIDIHITK